MVCLVCREERDSGWTFGWVVHNGHDWSAIARKGRACMITWALVVEDGLVVGLGTVGSCSEPDHGSRQAFWTCCRL